MKGIIEIRLGGSGGQGLLKAGMILAAAAIMDGKNAIQTQSYGPEARGGASKSDVLISDNEILYPKPQALDYLLALNQISCDKFFYDLKEKGKLIIDNTKVSIVPVSTDLKFPFTDIARKELGNELFTNIIALSTMVAFTEIVSKKSLLKAVEKNIPPQHKAKNVKAVEIGFQLERNFSKRNKYEK